MSNRTKKKLVTMAGFHIAIDSTIALAIFIAGLLMHRG